MPEKWIYWFDEVGKEQNDVVGKKCANLGEMTRLGLPVPPGFALSRAAYTAFMDASGAADEMRLSIREREKTFDTIAGITELRVVEKRLGSKMRCVLPSGKGVVEQETPGERSRSFCLSDEEAAEIARGGCLLEAHFGAPQDAEWAIDEDLAFPGNVIWLQTRNEVVARKKEPVDQLLDMMLMRFVKA